MNNNDKYNIQDFVMELEQIDYTLLINILKPIVFYYISKTVSNSVFLYKDKIPTNVKKVIIPAEVTPKYDSVSINKEEVYEFRSYINEFATVMLNTFQKKDLTNFINNINELKVKTVNRFYSRATSGQYSCKKNLVSIKRGFANSAIYHELFHMASSKFLNGVRFSGFYQNGLGDGLNEGYTELLTNRYFNSNTDRVTNAYQYMVFMVDKVEKIVGQEKMESLYLNANLKGLIDELSKYTSDKEVMKFISDMDFLLDNIDNEKKILFKNTMIEQSLRGVNRFVIKCYSKKLFIDLSNSKISEQDCIEQISKFISSLGESLNVRNKSYQLSTEEDIKESVTSAFSEFGSLENLEITLIEDGDAKNLT